MTFLPVARMADNGIAAEMDERTGNACGGLNTRGSHNVTGRNVLQHEKIMFIAGLRHVPGEAFDRVINLATQGIAIRHQGGEAGSGFIGDLHQGIKILWGNRSN